MARKLAAILSADVAGFSRLTATDEEGALATLAVYRAAIGDLVDEHGGRIFSEAGDGLVAEFPSAVQAVRCAVAMQRALWRRNRDLPDARRLEYRIGVNLGDVVEQGSDLLGDGVNVAARLQEIASAAGVCISGSIREQIEGRTPFALSPLGERRLKNIPRSVLAWRVEWPVEDAGGGAPAAGPPGLPDKPSIAVLPFDNMSGDPEQDYFADGITEDIITALSRHRWFFVIARNSSFAYKGRAVDVKTIARELGVRYVLEGSVRRAGARVRVTGQLIEAETGAHLWAERFDREVDDVFAVQDEVTERVVAAIEPEMLLGEGRRALRSGRTDPDAHDCCIRGHWHIYQATREDFVEAERWLRRALAIDPRYPRAHMALARVLYGRSIFAWSRDVAADGQEAARLGERAVALDERDPYCHYAAFCGAQLTGRLQAGLASAQRSIDLNPNFALGFLALGTCRIFLGGFAEAVGPLLRTLRISPNDPLAFLFVGRLALARFHLGAFEEGLAFAERALAVRRMHMVLAVAAACLVRLGRIEEARALAAEAEQAPPPDPGGYWRWTYPYADPARREELFDALRRGGFRV